MNTHSPAQSLEWTDTDTQIVNHIRALVMDTVEKSNSGHPGAAMSLAPAAYLLFQRILRHDPADPDWAGRDRFVLSCGHSSLTLYVQLYLSGYGLELEDLQQFRQRHSRTPGHPEYRSGTPGVETTTGPLGQGLANAVGMAMAQRFERGLFDPDAPASQSPFDTTMWVFASDGDMQEGIQAEAASIAGHQKLGNLVVLYDDNHISIEGDTAVAFTEDVLARYEACGWHVQRVEDAEDVQALYAAMLRAQAVTDRPSLIASRSIIAYPAPSAQNTGKSHGAALGAEEVAATKKVMGLDPAKTFDMPADLLAHARQVAQRGAELHAQWQQSFDAWAAQQPERAADYLRISQRRLPANWNAVLPDFAEFTHAGKSMATRKASHAVLTALAPVLPELWGGSADLAESNGTQVAGLPSFLPVDSPAANASPYGRTIHFGIREHAMGAILNGIAIYGGTRPYGGTFLVFSDYMRPAVRLAALMRLPVTYIWTHDSIGLGEDGPTHQPVEQLWALRAIPGLDVVRPADATETAIAWQTILRRGQSEDCHPAGLCLTRQDVPVLDRSPGSEFSHADGTARGAYILREATGGKPQLLLLATGSEVAVALEAQRRIEWEGVPTRVVSLPCLEWFAEQDPEYRESVLPADVAARVSIEAGIGLGWRDYVGPQGEIISLEHFGVSAPYPELFDEYGFTVDNIVTAAHTTLGRVVSCNTSKDLAIPQ